MYTNDTMPSITMNEEKWILYQTTNICNGKIYVGVHKPLNTWKSRNYLGSGKALKPAIEKYGRENFRRATLAEFSCAEEAYVAEAGIVTEEFIKRSDTYNVKVGGEGGVGLKHTDESRAKISTNLAITLSSPEIKAKKSAAMKGRPCSEDTRARISAALNRPETKARKSAAMKGNTRNLGKVASEETRTKLSALHKGKPRSDETKAKISASHKGKVISEESKSKMSASKSGDKNCRSIAVVINGVYYPSGNFAAKIEAISLATVFSRIKSTKWSGYRFATPEEKAAHSLEASRQST